MLSSPEAAELSKLLEKIFRSVNIALVNELAQLCDRLGIDVWEVIDAASTKPFGFMRFEPGPGLNDMKPYGLVAAAATTSQTSMAMRSHNMAISLTSAMLTERKMFSRSFVSSATSSVETGTTSLQTVR